MNDYAWYGIATLTVLAALSVMITGLQSNREARCKRYGHSWQLTTHGWTCIRCGHYWRT